MTYYLNNEQRDAASIKTLAPRTIQKEAIERIKETISNQNKILINMPCRTGKTFVTLYAAYKAGIKFAVVLCGKASAKESYKSDSTWKDSDGNFEGFNIVLTDNAQVKAFLNNPVLDDADRVLIEVTPQLLNINKDLVDKLAELMQAKKSVFIFDEAHFTEQTSKTKDIVQAITDDDTTIDGEVLDKFNVIPWVYLTASPDTQSLQNRFSVENGNYYEVTKEMEWALYQEDLKKPAEEREFNYVPVRNCLYVMKKLLDSVFNSAKSTKQDYTSLFTLPLSRRHAKKFVQKSLTTAIETINQGPDKDFMAEDTTAPYSRRGSNINMMIKVPVNSIKTNKTGKSIAENVEEIIRSVETEILEKFPEFTAINIKDVTQQNNVSQKDANEFFDSNLNSINIILTQQRLIEGATLYNLDAFLYYCGAGTLPKYKQESGRTLTPALNKRFGFIFFFDEDALANVKAILQAKINKLKGNKKHGPRKLSEDQAKKLTRINPTFVDDGNGEMKLLNYSQSLYSKTELEKTRIKQTLFDKEKLFAIPGLRDLIAGLLTKMTNNTTRAKVSNGNGSGNGNSGASITKKANKPIDTATPVEEIETEKFVNTLIYMYQDCIQYEVEVDNISAELKTEAIVNGLDARALDLLYSNDYTYQILMEIYEVLLADQTNINPEEHDQ